MPEPTLSLAYSPKATEDQILATSPVGLRVLVETHDRGFVDSILFGDNLPILARMLPDLHDTIDLIYIDPPFGTGRKFADVDGLVHYDDARQDAEFIEWLRHRLVFLREMLSPKGTIYLHIDDKIGPYVRVMMDEVFGRTNFLGEVARVKSNPKNFSRKAFGNVKDVIYIYARNRGQHIWNDLREGLSPERIAQRYPKIDATGRRYTTIPLHAPGTTAAGPTGQPWRGLMPPSGRHWRSAPSEFDDLDARGLIEWSGTGNPRRIIYPEGNRGEKVQDVWLNYKDKGLRFSSYPTEKNHEMLRFIIGNSSNEGSVVLDCFAGSGSTLFTAAKMDRHFIAIDLGEEAWETLLHNFSERAIEYNLYASLDEHFEDQAV
jgi:adenine-specific DNA-methyltransferase